MSDPPHPTVLHVDLDAFFVSMEMLRHPGLRGTPVLVAGGLGPRSVVSTCSYEARAFGIRSAMPLATARRLCPTATVLTADFSFYGPASRKFHAILGDFTPLVEPAGADEAYLDLRGTEQLWGGSLEAAQLIRRRIMDEIGITGSVGIASNKLVAKVASDAAKPDGVLVVPVGYEGAFLAPRAIRDLPAVGPKTSARLQRVGVRTIGDLAALPLAVLEQVLGQHGADLQARARGIHNAPVTPERGPGRSISREHTFGRDESDRDRLHALLLEQSDRIAADLRGHGQAARTVTLKLRFPPFETITRSTSSQSPLATTAAIFASARALFDAAWADQGRRPVRLIGTAATGLQERVVQMSFATPAMSRDLDATVDAVRARFGREAIRRATELAARPGAASPTAIGYERGTLGASRADPATNSLSLQPGDNNLVHSID